VSLILFVLHDPEKLESLLAAWEEAGVSGVTVLQSTGMGRIRQNQALREDMPMMPSLEDFFPSPEDSGRTIFSIVRDQATVEKVVAATVRVVGELNQPNTGLLIVLPTDAVYGLEKRLKGE